MEVVVLKGKYWRLPTRYYVGFKDGKFTYSTRKKELDKILEKYAIISRAKDYVALCKDCKYKGDTHLLWKTATSNFHYYAMKKALNCKELEVYELFWVISHALGWAVIKDDIEKVNKVLLRLDSYKLKLITPDMLKLLPPLEPKVINKMILVKVE